MFTERNGLRGVRNVLVLYTDVRSHPKDTEMFYLDVVAIKVKPPALKGAQHQRRLLEKTPHFLRYVNMFRQKR